MGAVQNDQTFRLALKCVRFWAHSRGLYSVNCGYFSGITLSVMVAKLCQDFPELQASCILYKFFERYAESDWRDPVQINIAANSKQGNSLIASHLSALDRISNDVMVVLVPIDQIKNTSYRVSDHTFYTICTELHRARTILKQLAP
jgi:poly(A) polymerase